MLLKLARSPVGKWSVGLMFEKLSFLLPVERLFETDHLVAFYHPKPVYPIHILIVPKKAIPDLVRLGIGNDEFAAAFMQDLLGCVGKLVLDLGLEASGYRLVVNGGSYQDVPELHFHLLSGNIHEELM